MSAAPPLQHVRAPSPVRFPSEAEAPVTKRHNELRTQLFQLLTRELKHVACIGCNQFVYWNASDPKRWLAPDAFVRLGTPDVDFDSWKTWERGAPHLAVEIRSESESADWDAKLEKYAELGTIEIVRFDPDGPVGQRLRVWDRVDGDLIERVVSADERTAAVMLGMTWVVAPADGQWALRLARDASGLDLVPTLEEARLAAEAKARAELEARVVESKARAVEADARAAAERRVAELEAELRRRNSG